MNMFDPNATPECDENWIIATRFSEQLERRARIAEHELLKTRLKLNQSILFLQGIYYSYGRYNDFSKRLEDIERVIE